MTLSVLRPISEPEFLAWQAEAIPVLAAEKVASGQWPEAEALDRSRTEFDSLLPQGRDTANHYHFTIQDDAGGRVGTLWFASAQRGKARIAYVYDVSVVTEPRRQGHAVRALRALEEEVRRMGLAGIALHVFGPNSAARALYAKLGYTPTNINMYKPLAPEGACAVQTLPR